MAHSSLIFDLDGTLIDPREGVTRCLASALERLGVACPPARELEQYIGPPLRAAFSAILGNDTNVEEAVVYYRERYGTHGVLENHVYPGIIETLRELSNPSRPMFIATTKPRVYAEKIVRHFGLAQFFAGVYGCELDGSRSDKTELLAFLLEQEGLPARSAVMIGDRKHDMVAARAHGMRAIGVGWGFGSLDELRSAGTDELCLTVDDLARTLRSEVSG